MAQQKGVPTVDPFRIWFEPQDAGSVWLKIGWAERTYAVQLTMQR
jgi:hypothetical protein